MVVSRLSVPCQHCCFTSHWLLIHAFFNLNRVCKTGTPMPLLLTYLMPEAASSICEGDGHILSPPLYTRLLCAPDTRHTYQIHLSLDHWAERGRRE